MYEQAGCVETGEANTLLEAHGRHSSLRYLWSQVWPLLWALAIGGWGPTHRAIDHYPVPSDTVEYPNRFIGPRTDYVSRSVPSTKMRTRLRPPGRAELANRRGPRAESSEAESCACLHTRRGTETGALGWSGNCFFSEKFFGDLHMRPGHCSSGSMCRSERVQYKSTPHGGACRIAAMQLVFVDMCF